MCDLDTKTYNFSFVVASRNDNHGGDLNKRMTIFINCLKEQCKKHRLSVELIIVEWNPVQDNPLLHQILPNVKEDDYLTIRYIIVPNEIHTQYKYAQSIPLYQMIAKNVGIRRAKAEFVLCTNIDLLFSDELFKILANSTLGKNTYYRANRCDIPSTIDEHLTVAEQFDFCKKNTLNRLGKSQPHDVLIDIPKPLFYLPGIMKIYNRILKSYLRKYNPVKQLTRSIDTVACGDFTLMHKDAWLDIQGYLEADMYSLNIDSLALFAAQALGYEQCIFPINACTFHISHSNGWEDMNQLQRLTFSIKRPYIEYYLILDAGISLFKTKERLNINPETWGFANENFKEYIFQAGKPMQEIN